MNIIKEKNRIDQIDLLLRQKETGNSYEFANRIGVSRSTLMKYIEELRSIGVPIIYNKNRRSYEYKNEGKFVFGFTKK